jgi:hypothetical protein
MTSSGHEPVTFHLVAVSQPTTLPIPPGRRWLSYTHRHWVRSRSYFTTDSHSVSMSSTLVGLATRYYFLSDCCWGLRSRCYWRSVSQYVLASNPPWDLRPILILSEFCCIVSVGRPLWRESNNCPSSGFFLLLSFSFFPFYMSNILCIHNICKAKSAHPQYSRSCSIICSLRYNGSLNTWTVVRLTPTKFKALKFSMSRFAFPILRTLGMLLRSEATLRLTVSQSICLGVELTLGIATRY